MLKNIIFNPLLISSYLLGVSLASAEANTGKQRRTLWPRPTGILTESQEQQPRTADPHFDTFVLLPLHYWPWEEHC